MTRSQKHFRIALFAGALCLACFVSGELNRSCSIFEGIPAAWFDRPSS
ncbi:MAG: hypothetical protein ABIY52_06245 [Gemmatimonadaceae bacterium]